MERYVTMKAQVTPETAAVWREFMRGQGVTLASILEAGAEILVEAGPTLQSEPQPFAGMLPRLVTRAQEVAEQRRRRAPDAQG